MADELPSATVDNEPVPEVTPLAGVKPVGSASIGALSAIPISPGGYGQSSHQFMTVSFGTVTLNGATPVTVANANVTPNSMIGFTLKTVGGTVGTSPTIETITPGTGFTVQGTAADTSQYNYLILG